MRKKAPAVNYRQLRFRKLLTPQYRHILLLLYWPVYGLVFFSLERVWQPETWHIMHCFLDDRIPLCEWFVFAYLYWFVFLIGTMIYTFFYDVPVFRKMMGFIIFTYTTAIVIFILYPNCQQLRPAHFPRDNPLTRFLAWFYRLDTNTNVCPSLHVVGSMAAMFALWQSDGLPPRGRKITAVLSAALISASTVFLKQHSVWDVLAGLALGCVGYVLCFRRRNSGKK